MWERHLAVKGWPAALLGLLVATQFGGCASTLAPEAPGGTSQNPPDRKSTPVFDKSKLASWQLAYVKDKDIWLAKGDLSGARVLIKNADSPTWSPDSQLLAYRTGDSIRIRDMKSGQDRLLRSSHDFAENEWSRARLHMSFDPLLPEACRARGEADPRHRPEREGT